MWPSSRKFIEISIAEVNDVTYFSIVFHDVINVYILRCTIVGKWLRQACMLYSTEEGKGVEG